MKRSVDGVYAREVASGLFAEAPHALAAVAQCVPAQVLDIR